MMLHLGLGALHFQVHYGIFQGVNFSVHWNVSENGTALKTADSLESVLHREHIEMYPW